MSRLTDSEVQRAFNSLTSREMNDFLEGHYDGRNSRAPRIRSVAYTCGYNAGKRAAAERINGMRECLEAKAREG